MYCSMLEADPQWQATDHPDEQDRWSRLCVIFMCHPTVNAVAWNDVCIDFINGDHLVMQAGIFFYHRAGIGGMSFGLTDWV